jgi:hypothetical protein
MDGGPFSFLNHALNQHPKSLGFSRRLILQGGNSLPITTLRFGWTKASVDADNHRRVGVT